MKALVGTVSVHLDVRRTPGNTYFRTRTVDSNWVVQEIPMVPPNNHFHTVGGYLFDVHLSSFVR